MQKQITEYALYRWRYIISYGFIGVITAFMLGVAVLYVPGGLSEAEMNSAVTANSLSIKSFDPVMAINFPYVLLQRISFVLFGITTLSIKLPSLLLGLVSALGVILLLRSWVHDNVAIIATLIATTSGVFIFTSQNGTALIMYIFLPVWLLLTAMMASRHLGRRSLWEFFLVAVVSLSLYTPLSVYIVLALLSATLLHPHLRFILGRMSKQKLIIAGMIGLVLLAPLLTSLAIKPSLGLILLGIPSSYPDLQAHALRLAGEYFGFLSGTSADQIRPTYTLTTLLFVILGLTRLFTTKYTARSYIITSWVVLLLPVILLNPGQSTILFVPIILLVALGGEVLLSRWYRLFPRNPYARIAGLVPITIIVAGMTLTGMERYLYGYRYNPVVAENFSNDLDILNEQLRSKETNPLTLVASQKEVSFYESVVSHETGITVVGSEQSIPSGPMTIITRSAYFERKLSQPSRIVTNNQSSDADRFYVYKTMP